MWGGEYSSNITIDYYSIYLITGLRPTMADIATPASCTVYYNITVIEVVKIRT